MSYLHVVFAALLVSGFVGGCSIRPETEEFTNWDPYVVMQHIRCEMKDAIRSYARGMLRDQGYNELADQLRDHTRPYTDLLKLPKKSLARQTIERYRAAGVGYEFTFDITEQNVTVGSLGLQRVFTAGNDFLPISATSDLKRQNVRNFRIYDTFETLLFYLDESKCSPSRDRDRNIVYPLTGNIGLNKTVGHFLNTNEYGHLVGLKDAPAIPTLADTITFTTKFSGSINPNFALTPAAPVFILVSAGVKFDNSRQDMHQLIVVLTYPDSATKNPLAARIKASLELDRQRYIQTGLVPPSFSAQSIPFLR